MARPGERLSPGPAAPEESSFPSRGTERRLLQAVIALAGFVPVGAGLMGALLGSAMTGEGGHPWANGGIDLDSHVRYLSGLLLGIGLAYWEAIPQIERRGQRVRLLTAIVMLGGLMRLIGFLISGVPHAPMLFGVAMELGVTPLVCLWQARIARRFDVLG